MVTGFLGVVSAVLVGKMHRAVQVAAFFAFAALFCSFLSVSSALAPCYPAVFVFGDSLSDTGNGKLSGNVLFRRSAQAPYGETFPGFPFSRFSDGHLLVDFLASFLGLPLVKPFLDSSADFSRGVNYAIAGSTAQEVNLLRRQGIFPLSKISLDIQIGWHLDLRSSDGLPNRPDGNAFSSGLYVLEIGGNDYIGAIQSLYKPSYITSTFIPRVITKIRNATEVLYANGARNFLFLSITPLGCSPSLLSTFLLGSKDDVGCLDDINTLSYNHGVSLLNLVDDLRAAHTDATFMFFDYYGAYSQVIRNKDSYGFSNTLDACCGAGPEAPYNYNALLFCNSQSNIALSTLCPHPNVFLNWDGIHFTDRFNSIVFNLTIATRAYLKPSNSFSHCIHAIP